MNFVSINKMNDRSILRAIKNLIFKLMYFQEAWMDQNEMLARITQANRRDVMQLLNFLNFEIEYILRPRSAPAR